jgi:hypothetical protein
VSPLLLFGQVVTLAKTCLLLGSSRLSPPLKRVAHPDHVSIQIIPRTAVDGSNTSPLRRRELSSNLKRSVLHSDTIRITVKAFSDTFHLHLQPNDELIHPAASVKYMKTTPTGGSVVDRVERLPRESFMVFGGDVIDNEHTSTRLDEDYAGGLRRVHGSLQPPGYRGWARIMVVNGGDPSQNRPPIFEGAFSVDGVIHHVLTSDNYLRSRLPGDPELSAKSEMVIFRDSDIMSHAEANNIGRGAGLKGSSTAQPRPQTCAHDRLDYNVDNLNPVIRYGTEMDRAARNTWLDPFGLASLGSWPFSNSTINKRQGDIGGGDSSSTK